MIQAQQLQSRIEAYMRERHMKFGMLAVVLERHPQTISKRRYHPETYTVDELIMMARFFGITLAELVGGKA